MSDPRRAIGLAAVSSGEAIRFAKLMGPESTGMPHCFSGLFDAAMTIYQFHLIAGGILIVIATACTRVRDDLDYDFAVQQTWSVEGLSDPITQFESAPWQPWRTEPLRARIIEKQSIDSRSVLEIGTGTGFFAIFAAREGASRVVALAPDRVSHACARYNVAVAQLDSVVEVRDLDSAEDFTGENLAKDGKRFDRVVVGTESDIPIETLTKLIARLPSLLAGGGKAWVICDSEEYHDATRRLCDSLGFSVAPVADRAKGAASAKNDYPVVLEIDPFVTSPVDSVP
jgi:precorrin-6B methylase 2